MTETDDIDDMDEAALGAYIAERTVTATVEEADRLEAGPDLQQALRDSGARQIDEHSFATNQGTVILMSPADAKRMALSDRLQVSIDRRRKWGEPHFLGAGQHALRGRGK